MFPEDREAGEIQSLPETKDLCTDVYVSQGFMNLWIIPDLELVTFSTEQILGRRMQLFFLQAG